jgi:hypothetical protein
MNLMTVQSWLAGLLLFVASIAVAQEQSNSAPPRLAILIGHCEPGHCH